MFCKTCARFHTTCRGVWPVEGWNGGDGGCSRWTSTILSGQTSLLDFGGMA
ncbi:MAG: hypothetical protein J6K69_07245 [Candidatus Methanomethylophilaceae archaeon]|nr:hypothetical protein [Candidatus Methanomethylophilaceae archaeon]